MLNDLKIQISESDLKGYIDNIDNEFVRYIEEL